MEYFALAFGVFGVCFSVHWINSASSSNDKFYAVFSLIGSMIFIACGVFLLLSNMGV